MQGTKRKTSPEQAPEAEKEQRSGETTYWAHQAGYDRYFVVKPQIKACDLPPQLAEQHLNRRREDKGCISEMTGLEGYKLYHFCCTSGLEDEPPTLADIYGKCATEEQRLMLGRVARYIRKKGLYTYNGSAIREGRRFRVGDGEYLTFTDRSWGELSQAILGEEERFAGNVAYKNKGYWTLM